MIRNIFIDGEKSCPIFLFTVCILSLCAHFLNYSSSFSNQIYQASYYDYLQQNFFGRISFFIFFVALIILLGFYCLYYYLVKHYPSAFLAGYSDSKMNLIYGLVQIVQWQQNHGLIIMINNKMSRVYNSRDGGIHIIYPLQNQSASHPIFLGSRLLESDFNISIAESSYLIKLLVVWTISDIERFYNSLLAGQEEANENNTINAGEKLIVNLIQAEISKLAVVYLSSITNNLDLGISRMLEDEESAIKIERVIERSNRVVIKEYGMEIEIISFRTSDLATEFFTLIRKALDSKLEDFLSNDNDHLMFDLECFRKKGILKSKRGLIVDIYPGKED